jgi:tryptophan-rich sensory protein
VVPNADLSEIAQTKEELQPMTWMEWYDGLAKPTWTPAPATIGLMIAVWKHYRWVAVAQVPYCVWVSLATVLQLSITAMNWGRS